MEDSSMINMPDLVFDEKIGNKRVRDGEDELHIGRLEKRPSGILGVNNGGDYTGDGGDEGGERGGGIIDTFISNVFHKNRNGTEGEVEVGGDEVKTGDEDKKEDLGVDGGGWLGGDGGGGGGDGDGDGGGGIINSFFSNIFQRNGSADEDGDQLKSDHLGGGPGGDDGGGGGGEPVDVNAEKISEKKEEVVDLPSKDLKGDGLKLKPDDYSERVFFLNNN